MKKLLLLLAAATLWLSAAGTEAAQGDRFTLKTVTGKQLHMVGLDNGLLVEEHKGKVVFIEFWGTHCPPCLISIPHYIDLQAKYKDKLAIVAIEVQATPEAMLKQFVQAKGINYDVIAHENAQAFIDYMTVRTGWQNSIPFLIILDQEGNFVTSHVGMAPQEALEDLIRRLDELHGKKSAAAPAPAKSAATPTATPAAKQ